MSALLQGMAALLLTAFASAQDAHAEAVPGTPLQKNEVRDELGRTVTYYVSQPPTRAPILLMVQGSGCARVLNRQGANTYSTLFNLVPYASEGRFTVVAVEKPFSGSRPGSSGSGSGTALSCTEEFNRDFTAETWLVALQATLKEVRQLPWVDPARTLVLGFSEGAVMAALLAFRDGLVTDVAAVSGSGTTQLFDLLHGAYQKCPDASPCLAEVERQARAIQADPSNATAFAWGHPYKRWGSFFGVDPAVLLMQSKARVYWAFGMADTSVPAASHESAIARLTIAGADLTVRRVPNGGHSLDVPDEKPYAGLDRELRKALDWFWRGK